MINLPQKHHCTGCSACMDVCPKAAITMQYDSEGFRYPIINNDICIECHLCEKKCPAYDNSDISKPYIKTFAGYNANEEELLQTTSGGFATALSQLAIDDGYVVVGVIYDKDFIKSVYSIASDRDGLEPLRFSKYVQSEKNGVYKEVKRLLGLGNKVLFIGCPCDVAGLNSVLGKIDSTNLLTCELVCMGATSPKIAEEFCKYIESKRKQKLTYICARSKRNGWFVPTLEMRFEDGTTKTEPLFGSYYGRGFQVYNRPSCFKCKYRGSNGLADIRIGDFWGIKKTDVFWNKDGVSCIFAKTEKGVDAIERLANHGFRIFEVDYAVATENNMSSLKNKGENYERLRDRFSIILKNKGLIAACDETADIGFKLKRIIPLKLQPIAKRLFHILHDKKI